LIEATKSAAAISKIFAYGIIAIGFYFIIFVNLLSGLWLIFIGWFLKSGADQSLKQTIILKALADINVEEIMTKEVVTIPPEKTLSDAVKQYFNVYKHGGYPVVEGDKVVGIVTISDLKNVEEKDLPLKRINEIMTPRSKLFFVRPNESTADAFIKFSKSNVGRLPVLEGEKLVGILSLSDVFRINRLRTRE